MAHDPSKILLGTTQSSVKEVDNKAGNIEAGLLVHLASDESLSVEKADGAAIGISLGGDLSNAGRTAICRQGLRVPVQLTDGFTPAIGTQVHISDTTGKAIASGAGATGINAIYTTGEMTGVKADMTQVRVALVDMPGGV